MRTAEERDIPRRRYFTTMMTTSQRCTEMSLLNHEVGAVENCLNNIFFIIRNSQQKVTRLHAANGVEFQPLQKPLGRLGIKMTTTSLYSPYHRRLAKQMKRAFFNKVKAMLKKETLGPAWWEEAVYKQSSCTTGHAVPS